jgi:mannose/cellobiose epimerase-like protein (N-acyl-D-glucosamine 2-epimerase family)
VREKLNGHRSVTLPPDAPFGRAEAASVTFTRMMDVDDVVDWPATNSEFITASAVCRERPKDHVKTDARSTWSARLSSKGAQHAATAPNGLLRQEVTGQRVRRRVIEDDGGGQPQAGGGAQPVPPGLRL